jgi:hypothetical protein
MPARRAVCRPRVTALDEPARMYVAGWETPGGPVIVDVVDATGVLTAHWECGSEEALAMALLSDATGHRAKAATAAAFEREVLALLSHDGFAISSQEVCAWLLVRAIDRLER